MVAELRANPTAQKEDQLGLEIATMPPEEREQVPRILLRIVAEERDGRPPADAPADPRPQR